MRKLVLGIHVFAMGLFVVASAHAHCGMCAMGPQNEKKEAKDGGQSEAEIKSQTTCPVMGGKISKSLYVDHDGKRVYLCCKGCFGKVKKDPAKYIEKLESEGITLNKVQTSCPVMGGKINKELYTDHDGKRVYFCCGMCPKKFKQDPEKFIKKLESTGITLDKVQTMCPVMGRKIDKKLYADHAGKRVYFCCAMCSKKFKQDPEKYIKKLENERVVLDRVPGAE